ncbi:Prefoldin subunit-domain-containing protein [Coniochaeta sp. 2T2.1]|nr:Prefoldin subunit-domain-containing protein [Coniochaeta sp. 2T2.1]
MSQPRDLTADLALHRQLLESTVSKLRASLSVWENWYIEYSHLKEDIVALPPPPQPADLARIRRDFDSPLITKKEINEIFGKNDLRKPEQVLSILTNRIDYVEKNLETLERQLEQAEDRLAKSQVVGEPDGVVDEESGLPITDIIEEIGEDGEVVNFRLQTGGDVGPKVLEALRKVGVDAEEEAGEAEGEEEAEGKEAPKGRVPASKQPREIEPEAKTVIGTAAKGKAPESKPASKRKSVSFAEQLEISEFENGDLDEDDQPKSRAAMRLEAIMQQARGLEEMPVDEANVPEDEDEDEAALRRDMLAYGASEIGPIVAELELVEGETEDDEDDYEFDYTEDEDSEDELGRSKHSVITDDYIKRMQELEKRLGVESAFANERAEQLEVPVEGLGQIRVVRPTEGEQTAAKAAEPKTTKPGKKGVRFAEELDVADEPDTTVLPSRPAPKKAPEVNPVSEVITERTNIPTPPPTAAPPTKKPSRFKKDLAAGVAPPTSAVAPIAGPLNAPVRFLDEDRSVAPSGPEGKTLADGVLEREPTAAPKDPDEMDAALLHQEAAVEYHRMRNKMIQREGGFNKEDERVKVPLDEEEGGPKRVSRFKAARLSRQ